MMRCRNSWSLVASCCKVQCECRYSCQIFEVHICDKFRATFLDGVSSPSTDSTVYVLVESCRYTHLLCWAKQFTLEVSKLIPQAVWRQTVSAA